MERKNLIALFLILGIATFFRLWKLDSIPPGLYPDEAINGNQALLEPGQIFYKENNGREGLFINLIALSFKISGPSIFSLRIVSAIAGILTVLGLYLFSKELFKTINPENASLSLGDGAGNQQLAINNDFVALLSSFFLAISFWHINFSRISFRAILVPFVLVFSFYFLFKGFRQRKILNFIISGVFFGLGFYTYIAFRVAVLLLAIVLILWWLIYRKNKEEKKFLLFTIYCLLFTVIIALPLGIYFLKNPEDFIGRTGPVSVFASEQPIKELVKSLILHLGMFNFYGDPNWRHNFSGSPQLFWPIGILFLTGLFLSIKELKSCLLEKDKDCSLFIVHCSLLSWFFIMLLPGILTYESIPHALRTIGVIPVVYIFAALGGLKTYEIFEKNVKEKKLLMLTSLLFLVSLASFQFNKYFLRWAQLTKVEGAFSEDYLELGNYLSSLPLETEKYVIVNVPGVLVNGIPMPAQTPMFMEATNFGEPKSIYLLPKDLEKIKIEKEGVIVLLKYEGDLVMELVMRFPKAEIERKNGFWIYKVE